MCPRYFSNLTSEQVIAIFKVVRAMEYQREFDYEPVETRPTTPAATVYLKDGRRAVAMRRWWLLPRWAKESKADYRYPAFNAKCETIDTKPTFRAPFKTQRCLLPASYFCEFTPRPGAKKSAKKDQWRIEFEIGEPMCFAGLWEWWKSPDGSETVESCTLITTEANEFMSQLPHERMPVILASEHWDFWLDPEIKTREPFEGLFRPWQGEPLKKTLVATE
jgi:putative SOS response-associated peptidase YedK